MPAKHTREAPRLWSQGAAEIGDEDPGDQATAISRYTVRYCVECIKTKAHVIGAITAKLDAFAADSNTINTSHYCLHLYTRQGMVDHTGCGGGYGGGDLNLKASFAASGAAGAVAPAVDAGTGQALGPISLAPGYGVYCLIDITPPAATGTARYRIGFAFDGAAPVYPAPASPTVMNAAVTRAWDGDACLSDAMQQQMPPATTPPTYYICPQA